MMKENKIETHGNNSPGYVARDYIITVEKDNQKSLLGLKNKINDYLKRNYVPPEQRKGYNPLGFSLFSLPIYLEDERIELDHFNKILKLGVNKIAFIGEPASGKTTAIKRILKTAQEQKNPKIVPIILDFDDIQHADSIKERVKSILIINESQYIKLREEKRLMLIYDGLNEPDSETQKKAELISKRSEEFDESLFLITCRTNEFYRYCSPLYNKFAIRTIKRLDQDIQVDFMKNVSEDEIDNLLRSDLIKLFKENAQFSLICNTPFIFLMFFRIFKKEKQIPNSISMIYSNFLQDFLEEEENKNVSSKQFDVMKKLNLLQYVAYLMTKDNKVEIDVEHLIRLSDNKHQEEIIQIIPVLLTNGLIISCGNDKRIKYFQQTLQEYLLAEWFSLNSIFPKHFIIEEYGNIKYKGYFGEFKVSEFTLKMYEEITGILNLKDNIFKNMSAIYQIKKVNS